MKNPLSSFDLTLSFLPAAEQPSEIQRLDGGEPYSVLGFCFILVADLFAAFLLCRFRCEQTVLLVVGVPLLLDGRGSGGLSALHVVNFRNGFFAFILLDVYDADIDGRLVVDFCVVVPLVGDYIENVQLDFWLGKSLEFWLEIPYTEKKTGTGKMTFTKT